MIKITQFLDGDVRYVVIRSEYCFWPHTRHVGEVILSVTSFKFISIGLGLKCQVTWNTYQSEIRDGKYRRYPAKVHAVFGGRQVPHNLIKFPSAEP